LIIRQPDGGKQKVGVILCRFVHTSNCVRRSFVVVDGESADGIVVYLNPSTLESEGIFRGDSVLIANGESFSLAIALTNETLDPNSISMNHVLRYNCNVRAGESVTLTPAFDAPYGKAVRVLPTRETLDDFTGNLFETFVRPYFLESYRPVTKGALNSISQLAKETL
jgi:transitional endoplasmic reticulum ATPase